MKKYDIFLTDMGWVGMVASDAGVRRTTLPCSSPDECVEDLGDEVRGATLSAGPLEGLREKIRAYLRGEPVEFVEPLDYHDAPPFFRAVWDACRTIPAGETRSYGWLASEAGRAGAARAAGQAMARNRVPIMVPCHRVVASDGGLCGFGKGRDALQLKQRLLDLDRLRALKVSA